MAEIHSILIKSDYIEAFSDRRRPDGKASIFQNKRLIFDKDSEFPESFGSYKFFNSQNKILYIGKAKNIKRRVNKLSKI